MVQIWITCATNVGGQGIKGQGHSMT